MIGITLPPPQLLHDPVIAMLMVIGNTVVRNGLTLGIDAV
jgi:hypothetical protein